MGFLDSVTERFYPPPIHKQKRKQHQTVELKVRMDCEGCERKVKKALHGMKGVEQVMVEPKISKVTVVGYVDPKKVLHRVVRKTGKAVEPWPYIPADMVPHPYVPGAYDKKAPPGYVRNVVDDPKLAPLVRADSTEETVTTVFSDENPNNCSIM